MLFGASAAVFMFLALLSLAIVEVMKGGKIKEVEDEGEKEVVVG